MSKPTILDPPTSPVEIDPGVDFKYVIPARNYNSLTFKVQLGFSISINGRTLTVRFINPAPAIDTTYSIQVTATNADGFTIQNIPFRVKASLVRRLDLSFFAACINGSQNLRYQTDDTNPNSAQPINARLAVGTKIKAVTRSHGTAVTGIDAATLFVVSVNDAAGTFKVSATSGGAPITPDTSSTYYFEIAFALNGSPLIYVGDNTSYNNNVFLLNESVTFAASDGAALPAAFTGGPFYIKEKVGPYYVKISATVGGAAINSGADSFLTDHDVELVADFTGGRALPAITSASEITMLAADAVDYTGTADIAPDSWGVVNLPDGLAFNTATAHLTGNLSGGVVSFYAVTLIAYHGSNASYRYLIILVTDAPETPIVRPPDLIYDVLTKRFYSSSGPAGRADRIDVVLGDPPLLIGLQQNGDDFEMPASSIVRVRAKQTIDAGSDLVYATKTLTVALTQVSLTEDWSDAGLAALFNAAQKFVELIFWVAWRLPSDPADKYRWSYPTTLRLWRNDSVGFTPGAPSFFIQTKPFVGLTGGGATKLDGVVTAGLAVDTWLATVVVDNGDGTRTKSEWFLVTGTDAEDPDAGIVRPDDYNGATNAKIWIRLD